MRRFLIGTIAMVTSLALMVAGVRAIGHRNRTPESRVFDPGNCSQPCWHGIQPGRTTLAEAETILRAVTGLIAEVERENPLFTCKLSWIVLTSAPYGACILGQRGIVVEIEVFIRTPSHGVGIPLGDAFAVIGSPLAFRMCSGASGIYGRMYISNDVEVHLELFDEFALEFPQTHGNWDEPLIRGFTYKQPGSKPFDCFTAQIPRWRGFEKQVGFTMSRYYLCDC